MKYVIYPALSKSTVMVAGFWVGVAVALEVGVALKVGLVLGLGLGLAVP
jgi:hypothetical protein